MKIYKKNATFELNRFDNYTYQIIDCVSETEMCVVSAFQGEADDALTRALWIMQALENQRTSDKRL